MMTTGPSARWKVGVGGADKKSGNGPRPALAVTTVEARTLRHQPQHQARRDNGSSNIPSTRPSTSPPASASSRATTSSLRLDDGVHAATPSSLPLGRQGPSALPRAVRARASSHQVEPDSKSSLLAKESGGSGGSTLRLRGTSTSHAEHIRNNHPQHRQPSSLIVACPPPRSTSLMSSEASTMGDLSSMLQAFPSPPPTTTPTSARLPPLSATTPSVHSRMPSTPGRSVTTSIPTSGQQGGRMTQGYRCLSKTSVTLEAPVERAVVDPTGTFSAPRALRASRVVSQSFSNRVSSNSFTDVRPVSIHFSPSRPPNMPLPALPGEASAPPNARPHASSSSKIDANDSSLQGGPSFSRRPPPRLPVPAPLTSPSPSDSSSHLAIEAPAHPSHGLGMSSLRGASYVGTVDEPEVSFDDLVQAPLPKKRGSSRRRSSMGSFGSASSTGSRAASRRSSALDLSRSRAFTSDLVRGHQRKTSTLSAEFAPEEQDDVPSVKGGEDDGDSSYSETSEDSEIDVEASLDASAWRAGIMSKALMEIDSEDEETQAASVRELAKRLSQARTLGDGRTSSPEQRRIAYKPYKIVRKSPSQHSGTDGGATSEEEEHFDLSFDHDSPMTTSFSDPSSSPVSLFSRRSAVSSWSASSYGPSSHGAVKARLSREGSIGLGLSPPLDQGAFEFKSHLGVRPSPSLQSLASVSEDSSLLQVGASSRPRANSTSDSSNHGDGRRRPSNASTVGSSILSPSLSSTSLGSSIHPDQPASPILRLRASTTSLRPLATVARMQSGAGALLPEKRFSTLPRLRRDAMTASSAFYDYNFSSVSPSSPSSVAMSPQRSISPTTPVSAPFAADGRDAPALASNESALTRRPSLKPLRTSRSSTVLNSSFGFSDPSSGLPRLAGSSSRSTTPTASTSPALISHGRRLSRSIPYRLSQAQPASSKLILPALVKGT